MKKIDYVKEIKKSAKNIDFDDTARRLFEEFIDFWKSDSEKLLNIIEKSNREQYPKINPEQVEFIYIGSADEEQPQYMCHMYVNNEQGTYLEYVYFEFGNPYHENAEYADIPNHTNFVKQFLNLAYALGTKFAEGKPKNPKKYHYFIRLKNGKCFHLEDITFSCFNILCSRYLSYNMSVYNRKIIKQKSKKTFDKLINKSFESKELYLSARKMFDNYDFLYAILKSLNSKNKIKIFNTCVEKNESYLNHRYMDNLFNYADTATSFVRWGYPKKITFLQDIAEKRKKTEVGKELYDRLISLYDDDKLAAIEMIVALRIEKIQKEMLNFLNSGETDTTKIYRKYNDILQKEYFK